MSTPQEKPDQNVDLSHVKEKPKIRVPEIDLTQEQKQEIQKRIPEIRDDLTILTRTFETLERDHPEAFADLQRKHPALMTNIKLAENVMTLASSRNFLMPDKSLLNTLDQYNAYAKIINGMLRTINREEKETYEQKILAATRGEIPFDEKQFSAEEKAEIQKFAKDLWSEMFPPSYVDQLTKWASGQSELEGYQKILLTPANGIEGAVTGLAGLAKPQTYVDFFHGAKNIIGMSKAERRAAWTTLNFTYNNLDTTDKIAPVLSVICAIAFLFGAARVITGAEKLQSIPKLKAIVESVLGVRTLTYQGGKLGKVAPLGVMAGVTLKYVPHPEIK